jgi:hypothetical protein
MSSEDEQGIQGGTGRSRKRRLAIALASAVVALAMLELAARLATKEGLNGMPTIGPYALLPFRPTRQAAEGWAKRGERAAYVAPDRELGWTLRPSATREEDGVRLTSNAQGFRARPERSFDARPAAGRRRVLLAGDSQVHGNEVELQQNFASQMESARSDLEVVNLAVPGYGTDQAFLRWRRVSEELAADAAVLGIWPENMLRNLNVLRFYLQPAGGLLFCKPRFVLESGELRLVNSPVVDSAEQVRALATGSGSELLELERWFDPSLTRDRAIYQSRLVRALLSLSFQQRRAAERERCYSGADPAAIQLTAAIAARFQAEVRAKQQIALVLVIPMREHVPTHVEQGSTALVRALREAEVDVLDLFPAFAAAPELDELFLPSGHLSPAGHTLVARFLGDELERRLDAALVR